VASDDAIQEYTFGEAPPEPEPPLWLSHDWTAQEVTFAAEYLRTGNGSRAWRLAFNSNSQHGSFNAARLLHKPWMRDYIEECRALIRKRLIVNEDTIIEEVAKLAYSNMTDFIVIQEDGSAVTDLSGLTREQLAALQEVTIDTYYEGRGDNAQAVKSIKFKLAPKLAALELLGKKHKLWTDVVENTSITDIADELRQARQEKQKRREVGDDDGSTDERSGQDRAIAQGDDAGED